jgi:hypothetical protein
MLQMIILDYNVPSVLVLLVHNPVIDCLFCRNRFLDYFAFSPLR